MTKQTLLNTFLLLKLSLVLFLIQVLGGALTSSYVSAETVETAAIDDWLESWSAAGFLSGCVLIAKGDEVIYEECFSDANKELRVPNLPSTRFAIASVTKAMHQVLMARMVDAGRLSLDDKVSRWIGDFPRGGSITVMQLVTHQAAIPHRVTEPADEILSRTASDMVELVKDKGLLAAPGGEAVYSSAGYSVLARVLEIAGEASWEELMKREVFDIAGMTFTVHPAERKLIPERASSYEWTPEGCRLTTPKDLSFLVGAGSLYSTPRDLFLFIHTLVRGGFGETAREYLLDEGNLVSNGLTNGYRTFADYYSESDLTVIICANVVTGALTKLRTSLPDVFNGAQLPEIDLPRFSETPSNVNSTDFVKYEGDYELRPGRNLSIRSAGDYLDVDSWMLIPMAVDTFFCVQDFAQVVFQFGEDSNVKGLIWGESNYFMVRVGDLSVENR